MEIIKNMDIIFDIIFGIKELAPIVAVLVGIFAICLAIKSRKVLEVFKEYVEVFFEKERILKGYDHHVELFRSFVNNQEDIDIVRKDIIKYQLNVKKIFSDEVNCKIVVHDCIWSDVQQHNCNWNAVQLSNSSCELYDIKIIKEEGGKSMPKIHYPNKSRMGQFGFVVKVKSIGKLLKEGSYYFIFFRLSGFMDQVTNLEKPQGCWLITEAIDYKNNKYPFVFEGDSNKSFLLTANDFMKK